MTEEEINLLYVLKRKLDAGELTQKEFDDAVAIIRGTKKNTKDTNTSEPSQETAPAKKEKQGKKKGVIVVAIIAERIDDTGFLVRQIQCRELASTTNVRFLFRGLNKTVLLFREGITNAVKEVGLSEVDIVFNLFLLRTALIHQLVIHISSEITIVLQEVGCHLHTGVW